MCSVSQPLKQGRLTLNVFPQLSASVLLSLSVCLLFSTQKQKKLAFSKLQHNDSYLKSLPKTSYYLVGFVPAPKSMLDTNNKCKKRTLLQSALSLYCFSEIFDLQKQLAERGHLKTHNDLEDFYRCIKYRHHPSQLHKSLEDVRKRS